MWEQNCQTSWVIGGDEVHIHIHYFVCFAFLKIFPKAPWVCAVKLFNCWQTLPPLSPFTFACVFLDNGLYFILAKTSSQVANQLQLSCRIGLLPCCLSWLVGASAWLVLRQDAAREGIHSHFKLYSEGFCYMLLCPKECFSLFDIWKALMRCNTNNILNKISTSLQKLKVVKLSGWFWIRWAFTIQPFQVGLARRVRDWRSLVVSIWKQMEPSVET